MSGVSQQVGQVHAYTAELAASYGTGDTVTANSANAFVIACALVGDVLAAPDAHIRMTGAVASIGYPTRELDGRTVMDVGADFAGPLPSDPDSRRYVLALRDVVRESKRIRTQELPARTGGVLGPWAVAGLVVLAAGVIGYLANTGIEAFRDIRREHLDVAQAGSDRAAALEVFRQTGRMPPPSAVETATADAIRRRAERETSAPSPFAIVAAGVATGAKWGLILLGAAGLALVFSSSKKG